MNNEEKILSMLEDLTKVVSQQGTQLAQQGTQLAQHSTLLERINDRLDKLESTQAAQGQLLDELDERSLRSAVMLENQVLPQLQLLYEGHGTILESLDSLAPKSRVEALEDDVAMMKDVIKLMRQEIAELKKAQ